MSCNSYDILDAIPVDLRTQCVLRPELLTSSPMISIFLHMSAKLLDPLYLVISALRSHFIQCGVCKDLRQYIQLPSI